MADHTINGNEYYLHWYARMLDRNNNPYRINIYEKDYVDFGEQEIYQYSTSPLILTYRTVSIDDLTAPIIPSEVTFNFFVTGTTTDDVGPYDRLMDAEYRDHLVEVCKLTNRQISPLLSSFSNSLAGTGVSWTITGNTYAADFNFNTDTNGWLNSGGAFQSNWAWNSNQGQGALLNTTVDIYGSKSIMYTGLTTYGKPPTADSMKITIDYELPLVSNSTNLRLQFIVRNSSNTIIFNQTFGLTGANTEVLYMNSNVTSAYSYQILTNSTNYVAGDQVYINRIFIEEQTRASVSLTSGESSKRLELSLTPDTLVAGDTILYTVMYHATATASSGIHQLYLNEYDDTNTLVGSNVIANDFAGFHSVTGVITATTNVSYISFVVTSDVGHGIDFYIEDKEVAIHLFKRDLQTVWWKGWVQPQAISGRFIDGRYFMSVPANDGLTDLQELSYPYTLKNTTGLTTQLQCMKDAIAESEILDLPFAYQDNTIEASMTYPLINQLNFNARRFIKIENGKITFEPAYDSLTKMLRPQFQRLAQSEGQWKVWNIFENISDRYYFDWNNIPYDQAPSSTTFNYDRKISLANSTAFLLGSDEVTRIVPVKYADTTYLQLNSGRFIPNSTFNGSFEYNSIGWGSDIGSAAITVSHDATNHRLEAYSVYPTNFDPDAYQAVVEEIANTGIGGEGIFNLNSASGSTITVGFSVMLDTVVFDTSDTKLPVFKIELWEQTGAPGTCQKVDEVEKEFISGVTKPYLVSLTYENTNLHFLKFSTVKRGSSSYTELRYYLSEISIFENYDDSLVYDKNFTSNIQPETSAVKTVEQDLYFGDGVTNLDASAILNPSSGLTTAWSPWNYTVGVNSSLPLVELYNHNFLKFNQRFKTYLKLTLVDTQNAFSALAIDSILVIKGKEYTIIGMTHDIVNSHYTLDLVELVTTQMNISTEQIDLSSADGNPLNQN